MSHYAISPTLRAFLERVRAEHLEEVAADYVRRIQAYQLPFLRFLEGMSQEQLVQIHVGQLDMVLGTLLDGTALDANAERLRAWENDEIPGIPKASFEPRELVQAGDAQEAALGCLIHRHTSDPAATLTITRELREFYLAGQLQAYETFTRIRDEAVEQAARADARAQAAVEQREEFQSMNEELTAQQEELNQLYEQLQAHSRDIEAQVAERTEELQAANEELEAHHEELVAVNEELGHQTTQLASQKAFMEKLVRHLPIGIAYLDRQHVFRWVNPEFASFAGLPLEAFAARSYYELFPYMENPNPRLVAVFESGQPSQILGFPAGLPGQEPDYWDMVYVPVQSEAGHIDGVLLMSQNATLRVRNEQGQQQQIQQLQEVDRLKNDFLSILSHELRTPINAIMGFASILDDEIPGPLLPEQRRYTQRILEGSEVLLGLIDDLLDMSRIQAGKFSLDLQPIDPARVLEDALSALPHLAEQKGQTLTLSLPPHLPTLQADRQRLRQVITNLVGNAIKFGKPNDTITVRATLEPTVLRCEVEDHGDGIAAEDIPKLFRRFSQLDSGNTRKAGGAGLGLSIVKALVEAHGGEVGVRSIPGERTTFWFTLPLEPATLHVPL